MKSNRLLSRSGSRAILIASGLLFSLHCGDDGSSGSGGDATGGGGAATGGGGAATGGEASGGGSGGAETEYTKSASVRVFSLELPTFSISSLIASFTAYPPVSSGLCTTEMQDGCTVVDCQDPLEDPGDQFTYFAAGAVNISGGAYSGELVQLDDSYYEASAPMSDQAFFSGGETLTVVVEGSEAIPGYTQDVVAPEVAVVAPLPTSIDRTEPLTVSWTGGGSTVTVVLSTSERVDGQTVRNLTATCPFDGGAGEGVVPASVLGLFPATSEDVEGSLVVLNASETREVVDGVLRAFGATSFGLREDGEIAEGSVSLE